MSETDCEAVVAEFIRTKGITRCPTAYVLPTHGLVAAADRASRVIPPRGGNQHSKMPSEQRLVLAAIGRERPHTLPARPGFTTAPQRSGTFDRCEATSEAVITGDRIESWPATATRSPNLLSQDKNLQWVLSMFNIRSGIRTQPR